MTGNWIISAITQQERRIAARMFGGSVKVQIILLQEEKKAWEEQKLLKKL